MGMNTRYVKEYFYKKKIRSMLVWNLEIIAAILLAAAFSWFFLQKCRGAGGLDGADSRAGGACADGLRLVPLKFSETRGYHRVPDE